MAAHFTFDKAAYLERLRLAGPVPPTVEGLGALQRAQLLTIPFENFDIQLGRGIDLSPGPLFDKLVRRPRGGYCFELNGLFLMALRAFGFTARPLLTRVHLSGEPSGRGHQLSLIDVGGHNWVADTGFGKFNPRGPLLLERDKEQPIAGEIFRLTDGGDFGTMFQMRTDGAWQNLYSFDMEHVIQADINYGNHYTSTNPNSFFATSRVAMKPRENGFTTLFNDRLTLTRDGHEEQRTLPAGQPYLDALEEHFGIVLDANYEDLRPVAS